MNSVKRTSQILSVFACIAAVSNGCGDDAGILSSNSAVNARLPSENHAGTAGSAAGANSGPGTSGGAGTGITTRAGAGGAAGMGGASGTGTSGGAGTGNSAGKSGAAGAGGAPGGSAAGGTAGVAGKAGSGGSSSALDGGGVARAAPDGGASADSGAATTDGGTGNPAWRPFSAASPWNTPIASNPRLAADSAALVADFAGSSPWPFVTVNIDSYSVPVYFVDANTPLQTVKATTVGGQGFESGEAQVPVPAGAQPAVGTDQHLAIVNKETHQEWGMWAAANSPSGWTCAVCATADLAGLGARPPTQNPPWWMGHGARACGFPLIAGLITVDEMRAGSIEHALAIAYPHIRSRYYTAPASTAQPTTDQALPTRGVPCGGHMQLDPTLNLDQMGLSASGKVIARALQKYGAIVGDFSGAMSLYADASPTAQAAWKTGLLTTYEVKDQIDLSKFRVLEMGTLYDNGN